MKSVPDFYASSPLQQCHVYLKDWFQMVQQTDPTIHIREGYRGQKQQKSYLKSGASEVSWGESAHN